METKDPALTKTPISSHDALAEMVDHTSQHAHSDQHSNDINQSTVDHTDVKGTQTLQETVIGTNYMRDLENEIPVDESMANRATSEPIAKQSVTHQQPLPQTVVDAELVESQVPANTNSVNNDHNKIETNTQVDKGTQTFDNDVVDSEHVNDGDNPARQPDRRDQQGSTAFDEGINEDTVGSEAPKSEGITDMNRYASVDNAQTRILNPDEKD